MYAVVPDAVDKREPGCMRFPGVDKRLLDLEGTAGGDVEEEF